MSKKAFACRTCGKTGHQARDCPCFKCGEPGHWAKNCPREINKPLTEKVIRSPFNLSEIHQVHSQGWTLSRTPVHRLLREFRSAHTDAAELSCGCHDRDPIDVRTLLQLLDDLQCSYSSPEKLTEGSDEWETVDCKIRRRPKKEGRKGDSGGHVEQRINMTGNVIAQWLIDIVDDPYTQLRQPGMPKVCIPFLVGDCFNDRAGRFCQAGRHLVLRSPPLAHDLVSGAQDGEAGMRVRLVSADDIRHGEKPGQVKAAPILGFDGDELITGDERNLWQKACIYPVGCMREFCRYAHAVDYC